MHYVPIVAFVGVYLVADLMWTVPPAVALVYLAASLACFIAYALDKSAARSRARRTPERTLLLLGLAGGWPGAVLAQQWLRHKSAKKSFRFKFFAVAALNVALFVGLAYAMAPDTASLFAWPA
jgi:uncharacterized membrane protein YsdA (DUF1294 family)